MQVPADPSAPAHQLMRGLASSPKWRTRFPPLGVQEWHVHDAAFYYDLLSPHAARIDLWETQYLHVLPTPGSIVDWYKSTGLRPFLQALQSDQERLEFLADYAREIQNTFLPRLDGKVLFPFRRLFLIAHASG